MKRSTALILLAFSLILVLPCGSSAIGYYMTVLGSGRAYGINNSGVIVGSVGATQCTWTSGGSRTNLAMPTGMGEVHATVINDAGVIGGHAGHFALRWNLDGSVSVSESLSDDTKSTAIDEAGTIYGEANISSSSSPCYGFKWTTNDQGAYVRPVPYHFNSIQAVNATGTMVGWDGPSTGGIHAVIYPTPTTISYIPELAGWLRSQATSINDAGVVVGKASTAGTERPFKWTSSLGTVDLGVAQGYTKGRANAINNAGFAVGYSYKDSGYPGAGSATLWTPDGTVINLTKPSGASWCEAMAINDYGQVVGYTNDDRVVLWTLVLPEPSALLALLCGVSGLAFWRKRR